MEQAYFSNIKSKIIPFLESADKEVLIAMAWFTNSDLFNALISCRKRGVKVELVILDDPINFMYYAPDFNLLIKSGGIIRIAKVENGFMHHKFCIIDNKYVITGSYNWTYYAEIRNLENIIISDNPEIIEKYKYEFSNLMNHINISETCPRVDWNEIETYQHINYDELNYEIENIAKECNLPEHKVVKSSTVVTITERPLYPVSKYNIGIRATANDGNDGMVVLIPSGKKLPFTSEPKTFYNYSDHRDNILCTVLYGNELEKNVLTEKSITEITRGRTDYELQIRVQYTLSTTGYLHAEIRCIESGRVIDVQTTDINLVQYED